MEIREFCGKIIIIIMWDISHMQEGNIMKKFLFACLLSMIVLPEMVFAAQPFPQSCYATTRCGARTSLTTFAALGGGLAGTHLGLALGVPGYIMGGVGGYIIGQNLGGKIAKNYSANEYLYFEDGTCLECDTYQMGENYECSNGIIVSNGSDVFRCRTQLFRDSWEQIDLLPCTDSDIQNKSAKNTKVEIYATTDKPVYDGVNAYSGDACLMISCVDGYTYDSASQECVENAAPEEGDTGNDTDNGASDNGQNNDNQNGGGESVTPGATQSCVQRRCGGLTGKTYSQCITCCYVPASVAVWNSGTRMCECVDKSKKFNPSTLQCEVQNVVQPQPTQPEEDYECDEHQIEVLQQLSVQYANNAEVIAQINQIFTYCAGDPVRAVFNNMFNQVNVLIDQQTLAASQSASRSRIESAAATLENIRSGLRLTVWRNDEGKFNTSRLLSDSIAGVVLGTAGGLITSNVVKKNQVEDGFEDLQCTVGGQVVAGWGDEFRVGIQ